jgi:hypothetical protein
MHRRDENTRTDRLLHLRPPPHPHAAVLSSHSAGTGRGSSAASPRRANQTAPTAHSTYTTPIATTPFTSVTPPYEMSAERSDMRESDMHTQK